MKECYTTKSPSDVNVMVQAKVNREFTSLGADLTSPDINGGYIRCIKSKNNSMVQDAEEKNVLLPQGPNNKAP